MQTKKTNIDVEQLRRSVKSSPESKLEWLYSAFCFARAPKKIVSQKLKNH